MRANNIDGFRTIEEYIKHKLSDYSTQEKDFKTLFAFMFSERENVMAEMTDGYRIQKIRYGEVYDRILRICPSVKKALRDLESESIVGLYMGNSVEWLMAFWAILACGYRPLLMNTRLGDDIHEKILAEHGVGAVISDGKTFSGKTFLKEDILVECDTAFEPEAFGSEVIFMSSGTSECVKLCAYTGENVYYQICGSVDIVSRCPAIRNHYKGELKQLTLLPFYHVFGFFAVYMWFGFFSRTFVFLRDMNPATILNTVRKHEVTHIFAVPLVWDTVYKEAMKKIRAKGDKTFRKFTRALALCNATGELGNRLSRMLLREVRENLFGDSICFMISGGSSISSDVLSFFNGVGYPMVNGYGMTEIGITSVEVSANKKIRSRASIGVPFSAAEYAVSQEGELLVRGKTLASSVTIGPKRTETDFSQWFCTHDLAEKRDGGYYLMGRADDLIVCENGEKINPVLVEERLKPRGCEDICLFADQNRQPVLLVSHRSCFSDKAFGEIMSEIERALAAAKLSDEIKRVAVTVTPLMEKNDFKVSRRKVAARYARGEFRIISPETFSAQSGEMLSALETEIRACFAEALGKQAAEIGLADDFFLQLGGSSLDYFSLLGLLKERYGMELPSIEDRKLSTVKDFCIFFAESER